MKKSDALKQKRASLIRKWDAIVKNAENEERADFSEEEQKEIDQIRSDIDDFDKKIEEAEDFEKRQKEIAETVTGTSLTDGAEQEKNQVKERFSITKMLRTALKGAAQEGAEKEAQEIAVQENRDAKVDFDTPQKGVRVMVPLSFIRADQQTVTQDSGDFGGKLVQDQAPRVIQALEPKLWIQKMGATLLTGLSGGSIPMPVSNSYNFEWLTEDGAITKQKNEFTGPTLDPKRSGAAVSINNRLIMQSSVDVEALVRRNLSKGWENTINSAAINGIAPAPTGLLNYVGVNVADAVNAQEANYARIVELQGLIEEDDATENSLGYLLHPKLKAALKTKSKDEGSGRFIIEGNELDGFPFQSTSLVPVGDDAGTAVYPLIYGDFSQMYIGQWGAVSFMVNPYSEDLTNSIRVVVNTHADIAIANPKAFAKNSFLTNA
ncbi:phage major capsid protein [Aquimarina sp. 2201CG14-23]|uniref:phage major capsid protein n=1 Tax=Aquimarina mycalae TaxID=3040073 RepID=UPI002477DF02|nr:phage major capsid protein [Aquimarina sp. 2201CG14-23]MDH7444671.1 phage major capsid protein [Aquimarina sp. 2201CG14-23]